MAWLKLPEDVLIMIYSQCVDATDSMFAWFCSCRHLYYGPGLSLTKMSQTLPYVCAQCSSQHVSFETCVCTCKHKIGLGVPTFRRAALHRYLSILAWKNTFTSNTIFGMTMGSLDINVASLPANTFHMTQNRAEFILKRLCTCLKIGIVPVNGRWYCRECALHPSVRALHVTECSKLYMDTASTDERTYFYTSVQTIRFISLSGMVSFDRALSSVPPVSHWIGYLDIRYKAIGVLLSHVLKYLRDAECRITVEIISGLYSFCHRLVRAYIGDISASAESYGEDMHHVIVSARHCILGLRDVVIPAPVIVNGLLAVSPSVSDPEIYMMMMMEVVNDKISPLDRYKSIYPTLSPTHASLMYGRQSTVTRLLREPMQTNLLESFKTLHRNISTDNLQLICKLWPQTVHRTLLGDNPTVFLNQQIQFANDYANHLDWWNRLTKSVDFNIRVKGTNSHISPTMLQVAGNVGVTLFAELTHDRPTWNNSLFSLSNPFGVSSMGPSRFSGPYREYQDTEEPLRGTQRGVRLAIDVIRRLWTTIVELFDHFESQIFTISDIQRVTYECLMQLLSRQNCDIYEDGIKIRTLLTLPNAVSKCDSSLFNVDRVMVILEKVRARFETYQETDFSGDFGEVDTRPLRDVYRLNAVVALVWVIQLESMKLDACPYTDNSYIGSTSSKRARERAYMVRCYCRNTDRQHTVCKCYPSGLKLLFPGLVELARQMSSRILPASVLHSATRVGASTATDVYAMTTRIGTSPSMLAHTLTLSAVAPIWSSAFGQLTGNDGRTGILPKYWLLLCLGKCSKIDPKPPIPRHGRFLWREDAINKPACRYLVRELRMVNDAAILRLWTKPLLFKPQED